MAARGFTLIELIVGVVLGAVVLRMSDRDDRALEQAARRSQALIQLACERAELTGVDIGFSLLDDRWVFGYLGPQGWQMLSDQPSEELRPRPLGAALRAELRREGRLLLADSTDNAPARPQLACLASGELSPFELRLGPADGSGAAAFRWQLSGSLDGQLKLEALDASR